MKWFNMTADLLQYVARYEENVTPGMIASVPSQGNEQMAAGILQVNHVVSVKSV